jgi:hypothetical protein
VSLCISVVDETCILAIERGIVGQLVETLCRCRGRSWSASLLRHARLFVGVGDSQVGPEYAALCIVVAAEFTESEQCPSRCQGVRACDARTVGGVRARVCKVVAVQVHRFRDGPRRVSG